MRTFLLAIGLLTILGCGSFTAQRVGDALAGEEVGGEGIDTDEERIAGIVYSTAPFLPSPWREAIVGLMSGLVTYSYTRRSGVMPPKPDGTDNETN